MAIQTVGVIGAGQMGGGIAHVCALSGYHVFLHDISTDRIEAGLQTIAKNMERQVAKGTISEADMKGALGRLQGAAALNDFANCDLVIEAASENEAIKTDIFKALVPHLKKSALVASNTSSISITRLAATTDRPDKFLGIHFMNPVPIMQLVELIKGIATTEETFAAAQAFVLSLGKTITVAQDYPGFVINRILMPMINEAVYTLQEGVGSIEAIDMGMKLGTNQPMGPLQLADFIGLDTCLAIMRVLHDGLGDSKYRPSPLLVKYVEAGWLGRKTKRGFYDYTGETPVPTR